MTSAVEFHRPSKDWLKVRCPCGEWSQEPCAAFSTRARRPGFEYACRAGKLHQISAPEAARLRSLIEHPGWQ